MKNVSRSKRGVIEVQFGWIFVIVVGALILLFFLSLVKSTSKSSTESKYVDLKGDLKSMISQSEIDVGTTRTIGGIGSLTLIFTCDGFDIAGSASDSQSLPYKTIFSPDKIKGREMITYSKYWDMPYKVDYFIYATSKQARYNFVNGSSCNGDFQCRSLLSSIIKELPANLTYQIVNDAGDVKENNYYKERFIFLEDEPLSATLDASLFKMKNEDVTAIQIKDVTSNSKEYGEIQYFKKDGNTRKFKKTINSSYLGIPMLLGAVIADENIYECNVNKSLQKFLIITRIYTNRTAYLNNYYASFDMASPEYSKCHYNYNAINLNQVLDYLINDTYKNFENIARSKSNLERRNYDLMIFSCPMIY